MGVGEGGRDIERENEEVLEGERVCYRIIIIISSSSSSNIMEICIAR